MKRKILIIDELTPYVYFIKRVLITDGYDVKVTDSEQEYVEYFNNNSPDLILIDVKINNASGFDYLKNITREINTNAPVIVISSGKDLNEIELAFDYGAYDYLIKPLNLRDMKNKINQALEKNKISKSKYHA